MATTSVSVQRKRSVARKPSVDAELTRQLEAVHDSSQLVEAIAVLRSDTRYDPIQHPERFQSTVNAVLRLAEQRSGQRVKRVGVFKHLGAFAVSAPAGLIASLIDQPRLLSLTANKQPESRFSLIKPVTPAHRKRTKR
jgi:hypothetical protein